MILEAVTEDDLRAVVVALVERAKGGETAAIHELLNRLVGKPGTFADLELLPRLLELEAVIDEGGTRR